jgi:hypothetical protein
LKRSRVVHARMQNQCGQRPKIALAEKITSDTTPLAVTSQSAAGTWRDTDGENKESCRRCLLRGLPDAQSRPLPENKPSVKIPTSHIKSGSLPFFRLLLRSLSQPYIERLKPSLAALYPAAHTRRKVCQVIVVRVFVLQRLNAAVPGQPQGPVRAKHT